MVLGHDVFSINVSWVLLSGVLVLLMQAGFAMVETGLCRAKNASHTISMILMVYPLSCLAFWAYGFALGWGNWSNAPAAPAAAYAGLDRGAAVLNQGAGIGRLLDAAGQPSGGYQFGLVGLKGFLLRGVEDPGSLALFFLATFFLSVTAAIPTGAMAERWRWKNFCLYALWVALPFSLFAHWVWGGGFLARAGLNWGLGHGAVDLAGSGVVHAMGGMIGLAGATALGPRLGKFREGRPLPMPCHQVPLAVLGTLVLAVGWFGFNAGWAFLGSDLRLSVVAVNTLLASVAGAAAAMFTLQAKRTKPDPTMMCNGLLAGLVAISAGCAFVESWAAVLIGAVAGGLVVFSVLFWEKRRIDDPVGAISVHGVNGFWGLIAVGLFADGRYGAGWNGVVRAKFGADGVRGLFYGDASQLLMQLLDAGVLLVLSLGMAYAWFRVSQLITPLRVARDTELAGLDGPEMGALGYPDFTVNKFS
jgi:Amt family ammonium transporter